MNEISIRICLIQFPLHGFQNSFQHQQVLSQAWKPEPTTHTYTPLLYTRDVGKLKKLSMLHQSKQIKL